MRQKFREKTFFPPIAKLVDDDVNVHNFCWWSFLCRLLVGTVGIPVGFLFRCSLFSDTDCSTVPCCFVVVFWIATKQQHKILGSFTYKNNKARRFVAQGHFLLLSRRTDKVAALSFMKDRQFKDKVSVPPGFSVATASGHLLEAFDDNFLIDCAGSYTVFFGGKPALYIYSQQQQALGRPKGSDIVSLDK